MLAIRELTEIYPGPVAALLEIDLDIPRGMFGLLGPNGAGKTTLMRIVAGLLQPTAGMITLDGEELTGRPERVWPMLGYLPQEFGFYPHLTGEKMLAVLARAQGYQRARRAEGAVRRAPRTGQPIVRGQAAGQGLLGRHAAAAGDRTGNCRRPPALIVDEPTAGLDPEERLRFYRLLSELAANRTVILSTHIVEDVAVLCPRFAVIRGGRLLAVTTPTAGASRRSPGRSSKGTVEPDAFEPLSSGFA